jgi:hypothetical protein
MMKWSQQLGIVTMVSEDSTPIHILSSLASL